MATSRFRTALLKLTGDPTDAEQAVEAVEAKLKGLDKLSPDARIRIRDEGAKAQLDKLYKRLQALGRQEQTPEVKIRAAGVERQIGRIEGRIKDVDGANRDLVRSNARLRTSFGNVWAHGGAAFAAVGGAYALKTALESVITAYGESEKVGAQTNAVLWSTHGAAKVSREEVTKLATAISKKTGFDDEAVQSSENLLLTFTRVRNEAGKGNKVFTDTTGVIGDMSRALGQDFKSSTIQVGKALNDPIKGLTALRRVGVSFTDSQEKTIKKLVESGHTLDAQKIILRELRKEFGGSADAYGKTMPGAIDKAKVAFENLEETIGAKLAPTVTDIATKAAKFIDQLQDGTGAGGDFRDKLEQIGHEIGNVLGPIARFVARVAQFADEHPKIRKVALGIVGVGLAIKALRFGAALTGVDKLLGLLRRVAQTKAGEKAAEAIASGLSGGGRKIRDVLRRVFRRGGAAGGEAAATAVANTMAGGGSGGVAGKLRGKRARFRGIFTRFGGGLGGAMGIAAAIAFVAKFGPPLEKWLEDKFGDLGIPQSLLGRFGDPASIPGVGNLNRPGGDHSAYEQWRQAQIRRNAGRTPRHAGNEGTGGRGHVVRRELAPMGLGAAGSGLTVVSPAAPQIHQTFPIMPAPSTDYVASRWQHRTADAMRRRGKYPPAMP